MSGIWKKREKQIGVVVDNAVEMRGEIEGLVSGHKVLGSVEELTLEGMGGLGAYVYPQLSQSTNCPIFCVTPRWFIDSTECCCVAELQKYP